ncbi:hypothetical protein [Idiomarina piscisalsi]|uniref:Lipoprotein n=1 Tax=Idiomarina piscisalsi TaxID=1096243 RepID=A0A432YRS8_9GAMM|nr:hypothetical protein [Idiomarina piscisalsi]RUO64296.1 hypothetical protein CWI73_09065 [Idiomarina piscisalsi]
MKIKTLKYAVASLSVLLGAAACSTTPGSNSGWHSAENINYLTPQSTEKVKFAEVGEVLNVVDTNRQEYELQVKERYFSASGKDCVKAQTPQNALVICEYGEERWGITRSFNQLESGRALQ